MYEEEVIIITIAACRYALRTGNKAQDTQARPMRSILMVSVKDDSCLPKAYRWLYEHHVPESISQFAPYVTQYATYRALPLPEGAKDFGAYNWIMTEHYWLMNPFNTSKTATPDGLSFSESYNEEYLRITCQPTGGELRPSEWQGSPNGYHPTVFAFLPVFWEKDYKGAGRTIEDGPNFRWLIALKYPEGVSMEEGDKWLEDEFIAKLVAMPEVTRCMSSKVLETPRVGPFQRVMEVWFEDSHKWEDAMKKLRGQLVKPQWATYMSFPFLEPYNDINSIYLMDRPESNHLQQYKGYIYTR